MSYQKNGYIYECDDNCKNCGRAKYCEDYVESSQPEEKEENKEPKQNDSAEEKNSKKEKYTQRNFLDLL